LARPMLTDEVVASQGNFVKIASLSLALGLIAASSACVSEQALAPRETGRSVAVRVGTVLKEVPLLFVVDGIRLPKDQVPSLSADQIAKVTVIKGPAALQMFGQDAAYGVVIVTTKSAATRGS
jgi:TonB-dependent SusC/RagA subfamily outer membrane receptor